jgi:hypothetical protein
MVNPGTAGWFAEGRPSASFYDWNSEVMFRAEAHEDAWLGALSILPCLNLATGFNPYRPEY